MTFKSPPDPESLGLLRLGCGLIVCVVFLVMAVAALVAAVRGYP